MQKRLLVSLFLATLALTQKTWADDSIEAEDDEYAEADKAHLIVRKHVKDAVPHSDGLLSGLVIQGRNVTVVLDIFNSGTASAHNVELKDTLPANATLVDGALSSTVGKVTAGSHVKHTYTIVFNSGNAVANLPLAIVTYQAEVDSTSVQESASTLHSIFVLTPVQQIQRYALKAGVYASLGFARTAGEWRNLAILLVLVGGLLGSNWATKHWRAASVVRQREKALKALEKEK